MSTSRFTFQNGRTFNGDFDAAAKHTFEHFKRMVPVNARHDDGTSILTVIQSEAGFYTAIAVVGPVPDLDLLEQVLAQTVNRERIHEAVDLGRER